MTWAWILVLAALAVLAVLRLSRAGRAVWPAIGAAAMLGLTGYAVQGRPDLPGAPAARGVEDAGFGEAISPSNSQFAQRFGKAGMWLGTADAFARRGRFGDAARLLEAGMRQYPDDIDLRLAYANALVGAGGGGLTPAARVAFEDAARMAPAHPGPDFFAGLAEANGGDFDAAQARWSALLARTPADAPWRRDLSDRLDLLRQLQDGPSKPLK